MMQTTKSSSTEENTRSHYLYPSALFAHKTPHMVDTLLGSCVAVCLWDKENKIGGINHYMLPYWNGTGLASPKYGNIAIERLIEKLVLMGSDKSNLQAKVFGGGEIVQTDTNHFKIGQRNIEVAEKLLKSHGIRIIGKSVGGMNGRKVRFNTHTGVVLMKFIQNSNID